MAQRNRTGKRSIVAIGGVLVAAVAALLVWAAGRDRPPPNVVWIYLDALRADHLGCYGYERDTSPSIDRLAARGVRFERAITQAPATFASVPSALTSRYASWFYNEQALASERFTTLPEILKRQGYWTAAVSSSPIVTAAGQEGVYARGFDHFDDTPGSDGAWQDGSAEVVVDAALRLLDAAPDRPWMLFVYVMDPHDPYRSPEPYRSMFDPGYEGPQAILDGDINPYKRKQIAGIDVGNRGLRQILRMVAEQKPEWAASLEELAELETLQLAPAPRDVEHLIALYDGKIRYADAYVGRLLDAIEQQGLHDDTIVVLSSDHGEQLYDHGDFGHGKDLYQETIHVPLIIAPPGGSGASVGALVQMVDVMPTLLELCGIEAPGDLDGASLTSLMSGDAAEWREFAFSEAPWIEGKALVTDAWKYIHYYPKHDSVRQLSRWIPNIETEWSEFCAEAIHPHPELFSLIDDPREQNNVHGERPEVAQALHEQLVEVMPAPEVLRLENEEGITISEATAERLRSLGYIK